MEDLRPLTPDDLRERLRAAGVPDDAKIALAVSGGADSMCLAWLARTLKPVAALVVDHRLRAESSAEAALTRRRLEAFGLTCEILVWDHETTPVANIQSVAREARYDLMRLWCKQQGVNYLLTAHHQDDQAETLLLRLARGSGVYGLAGMAPDRRLDKNIQLIRPLLDVPKMVLVETIARAGFDWIEDPSNNNDTFDRVKIRRFLEHPPVEGLSAGRLAGTAARLRRTRDAIEYYELGWLEQAVQFYDSGYAELSIEALENAPEEIILRGLSNLLRFAGSGYYAPRFEKLERLLNSLKTQNFTGHTLNGVQFKPVKEARVLVFRELAAIGQRTPLDGLAVWDNRFCIENTEDCDIREWEIGPLGEQGVQSLKEYFTPENGIPGSVNAVLPAFYMQERLIAVPHLNYSVSRKTIPVLTHRWLSSSKTGKKTYRGLQ